MTLSLDTYCVSSQRAESFNTPKEKDPPAWEKYLERGQTKNMALYDHADDETPEEKRERESAPVSESHRDVNGSGSGNLSVNGRNRSEESSRTRTGVKEHQLNSTITGQKIDPGKGRDTTMVSRFGDSDPGI